MSTNDDEWADWTNEALIEYEQGLYDREVEGEDVWELREAVLSEMRDRGLLTSKRG